MRSDIREFFTKIPKSKVIAFTEKHTADEEFRSLLESAMATELDNSDEIKESLYLFPLDDIGVPQGSSLSAFAGNVVLRDFDRQLNGRGIVTIRYIDDFVILGPSQTAVKKSFLSAIATLKALGMDAYRPEESPEKAKFGSVKDGFDFLGCSIRDNGVGPSSNSRAKLLANVEKCLASGLHSIKSYAASHGARRAEEGYVQTLASVDRIIRGWGDAFSFADNRLAFTQIDSEIDRLISKFEAQSFRMMDKSTKEEKRRALGVALLRDTPKYGE